MSEEIGRESFLLQYMSLISYSKIGKNSMVCCITAYNGFEVIGYASNLASTALDAVPALGEQKAYENALAKFDAYIRFVQYDRQFLMDFDDEPTTKCTCKCDGACKTHEKLR